MHDIRNLNRPTDLVRHGTKHDYQRRTTCHVAIVLSNVRIRRNRWTQSVVQRPKRLRLREIDRSLQYDPRPGTIRQMLRRRVLKRLGRHLLALNQRRLGLSRRHGCQHR